MAMPLQRLGSDTVAGPGYSLMAANNYTNYSGPITAVSNTFTVEFWVNPSPWNHDIDQESTSGYSGNSGQNFVWYPAYGGDVNEAAVGISVGLNVISVYEHGGNYIPPLLVWAGTVTGWTHVAVVYENRQPRLYVNGVLVHTGLTSLRTHVYPSMYFPGGYWSNAVLSQLDDIRVWGVARTGAQIAAGMNGEVAGSSSGLVAYWPMNEGSGEVLQDVTGNGYDVNLYPAGHPIAWWQSGAPGISPVAANKYRYAFNGKEKDQDIGEDDYDYGARIYDASLGRWLSVDPLAKKFVDESPYLMAGNSPLLMVDKTGEFKVPIHEAIIKEALKNLGLDVNWHFQIYYAQRIADIQNSFDDAQHFDNRFTSKDAYANWEIVNQQIHESKIRTDEGSDPSKWGILGIQRDQQLGFAIHAVQDFYSHSNYIESYIKYYKQETGKIPDIDAIPTYEEGIKDKKFKAILDRRLHTGGFNVPRFIAGRDQKGTHNEGQIHHTDLNKDDENSSEGAK